MCRCERSFVRILVALLGNSSHMSSSLRPGGGCTKCGPSLVWYSLSNSQAEGHKRTNFSKFQQINEATTGFLLCAATKAWCCITPHRGLLTLFIVEPWRFLGAAARHLSSARAWFATGSTAGQEACNYSSLQRCQSVKDGIHAFILANPGPLPHPLASSPFHLPPPPLTLLPPFPPALQLV